MNLTREWFVVWGEGRQVCAGHFLWGEAVRCALGFAERVHGGGRPRVVSRRIPAMPAPYSKAAP